jgi:hypothetical protein
MRVLLAAMILCVSAVGALADRHSPQTGGAAMEQSAALVTVEHRASAGKRHRAPRAAKATPRRGGLVAVRSRSGAVAYVAPHAHGPLQCVVNGIEAAGGHIKFMGGWRAHGSCSGCNKHPRGEAIDINQYARNVVRPALPANATVIAQRCGVLHGAVWRHADAGHFEVGSTYASRRHRHKRTRLARAG